MQEDFIHYLWKYKKFDFSQLKSEQGEVIKILNVGTVNTNAGPDFFNAKIRIGEQLWAGNVELHVKSSDWFLHGHELDSTYDNVILHVVWEHDVQVFRKDNTTVSTLVLKPYVSGALLNNYKRVIGNQKYWINCEKDFNGVNSFVLNNWLERLYIERLERKASEIEKFLIESKNDWEAVLFKMLAKNFGLKINGDAFLSLANSIDFSIIRKLSVNQKSLEALLFGQANMLFEDLQDGYYQSLQKEYDFIKNKFELDNSQVIPFKFFRLRPVNFPTIRLSQLASLYHLHQHLFSKLIEADSIAAYYNLFKVQVSDYWFTHYTFQKESKSTNKRLSKAFIDLLLMNTIIPVKFSFLKQKGNDNYNEILELAVKIKSEDNNIVNAFNKLGFTSKSALESQSLIQLKTEYCDKNNCLKCAVGNTLIATSE